MGNFFSNMKDKLKGGFSSSDDFTEGEEEYVELDTDSSGEHRRTKILVRSFVLEDFSDVKTIIDTLRDGYTITLINIKPLKSKDIVELKRAINKLKKTSDALSGDIAGFGEDWIVATPGFAEIYRAQKHAPQRTHHTEMIDDEDDEMDSRRQRKTVLEEYDTDDVF